MSEKTSEEKTKSEPEDDKVIEPDVPVTRSHDYFHGHDCHLPIESISTYKITSRGILRWIFNSMAVHAGDIRAINMHKSYAALCAEKYRHHRYYRLTIHPYSRLRFYLEIIFVILMIVASLIIAYHYCSKEPGMDYDYHDEITLFCDLMLMVNIIANFFTGYIEGHSRKVAVLSLRKIALNYLKTWLIVDLFACGGILAKYDDHDLTLRLVLESIKIIRIPITVVYLDNILIVMRASCYQKTGVEIFFFLIIFTCWNVYFQFAVEYIIEGSFEPENPRNCSWLTVGKLWNQATEIRLVYAFNRAVGMLTTNTNMNLLEQKGCSENFLVICWLFSKIFVFHFALKYIVADFGKESASAQYYVMKKQLKTYMVQRNFPPRLKNKIQKFYSIRFQSKFFEESRMLKCVSGQLREDILMHTGRQLVMELDCLKQLPSSLRMQIAIKLRLVIYIAGDIIFKINTVGDCLYFIDRGTVAIYSQSGKEICHLEDGDYFGEIELLMKNPLRTASVVAVTNCELFRLDRGDFEKTIAYFPTVYNSLKELSMKKFENIRAQDEHHKAELRTGEAGF